jgi:2-polyprenyl-3-methyl-5-hydroxy-6-metoxy-1,4-benzoquinol methylase
MTHETSSPQMTEDSRDALVGRLFDDGVAALDLVSVYLGDRLGLYRALARDGAATASELARRAGIHPRYSREWLEQQAATGFLEVDDATAEPDRRRYRLSEAHADVLIDPNSPYSMTPLARSVIAATSVLPQLLEAYRTGGGVPWSDYGADMIEAQGDFNRPWLLRSLGTEYLPAIPQVHERLQADPPARVADVACGLGWASIAIARAYPSVHVDGFDLDQSSIDGARRNAEEAGLTDRVRFEARDAGDPAATGQYDLALIVEALHDVSRPVEVLTAMRQMLAPGGVTIVADEKTADVFTAPADSVERLFYGFSITCCLPAAMTDEPSAATGTVMRADTLRRYATDAGFRKIEVLDLAHDALRFYLLTP